MLGVGEMFSKVFKSLLGGQIAKNFANIHGEQRAKIIQSTFPRHLKAWNRPPSYPASSIPLTSGRETSQACVVRNEDSSYENGNRLLVFYFTQNPCRSVVERQNSMRRVINTSWETLYIFVSD